MKRAIPERLSIISLTPVSILFLAVSHELVRHRRCSFLQESQRYCRYNSERFGGEVAFIRPLFFPEGSPEFLLWQEAMAHCERIYLKLLASVSF